MPSCGGRFGALQEGDPLFAINTLFAPSLTGSQSPPLACPATLTFTLHSDLQIKLMEIMMTWTLMTPSTSRAPQTPGILTGWVLRLFLHSSWKKSAESREFIPPPGNPRRGRSNFGQVVEVPGCVLPLQTQGGSRYSSKPQDSHMYNVLEAVLPPAYTSLDNFR